MVGKTWGQDWTESSLWVPDLAGLSTDNPAYQYVTQREPEFIAIRTKPHRINYFSSLLELDSIVDLIDGWGGVPWYGNYMSGSHILNSETILTFSPTKVLGPVNIFTEIPYLIELDRSDHSFVREYWFENPDSTIAGSYYDNLALDANGDLFIGMHIKADDEDYANHLKVIKCDTLGNLIWQQVIGEGGGVRYIARETHATPDGGVVIAAERYSVAMPDPNQADGIIIYKLDVNGQVVGLEDYIKDENLLRIYPNPVSSVLRFNSAATGLRYRINDALGSELVSGIISDNQVNVTRLSQGNYLFSILKDGLWTTTHFVILR